MPFQILAAVIQQVSFELRIFLRLHLRHRHHHRRCPVEHVLPVASNLVSNALMHVHLHINIVSVIFARVGALDKASEFCLRDREKTEDSLLSLQIERLSGNFKSSLSSEKNQEQQETDCTTAGPSAD